MTRIGALWLGSILLACAGSIEAQTKLISVRSDGQQTGNAGSSLASISADGRYVTFVSEASDLVAGDTNGVNDVFVFDVQKEIKTRVSVDSAGHQGNASTPSPDPVISGDGRYVAFASGANNLVAGDTNNVVDVFVRDRQTSTTTRVSVGSAGAQANGASSHPVLSADGRFVAFVSGASNLVAGDSNGISDIFVRDRQTGATTRVSVDSAGVQGNGDSQRLSISADGRYVAFMSYATNLAAGDSNGTADVFVRDRQAVQTTRVSVDSSGNEGNGESWTPSISGNGRFVAFHSLASNLVAYDTNGVSDIFVHDRQYAATNCADCQKYSGVGPWGNGASERSAISADGRFFVFHTLATNHGWSDTNNGPEVFIAAVPKAIQVGLISEGSGPLGPGETQKFEAQVYGTTNKAVTWGIQPAVGTITADGLYTAPSPINIPLLVAVTARSVVDPTSSYTDWLILQGGLAGPKYTEQFGSPFLDDRWTIVDVGTSDSPSNWKVVESVLTQTSNIYGGLTDASLPKPGTYMLFDSDFPDFYSLSNSTASVQLRSTDNDAIGLMFGYRDANNYYRFSMDRERSYRRLVKVVNGVFTVLAQDSVAYKMGRWYNVQATMARGIIRILLDGQELFSVQDTSHDRGTFALYSWNNAGAEFDDLAVFGNTSVGCTFSFNPVSADIGPGAGQGGTNVVTQAGCEWTVTSGTPWLTVTGNGHGVGAGTSFYTVTANSTQTAREGTLTLTGGATFTVRQSGSSGPPGIFGDSFQTPGPLQAPWTVVDEGTIDAPSHWFVQNGILMQNRNIYSGATAALPMPGTFALTGENTWSNY